MTNQSTPEWSLKKKRTCIPSAALLRHSKGSSQCSQQPAIRHNAPYLNPVQALRMSVGIRSMKHEFLMALNVKITVFWHMTPCSLVASHNTRRCQNPEDSNYEPREFFSISFYVTSHTPTDVQRLVHLFAIHLLWRPSIIPG